MLSSMVKQITGSYKITWHNSKNEPHEIDFTPPFKRVNMVSLKPNPNPNPNLNLNPSPNPNMVSLKPNPNPNLNPN